MIYGMELPDRCKGCPLMDIETVAATFNGRRVVVEHRCTLEDTCKILFEHFKELPIKDPSEFE